MSFSITSMNCRGLRDFKKRKDVFGYLRNLNSNIYCLQDTHIVDNDERLIRAQWGYNISMSQGRTDSRGVLNLFNNNFEYEITKSYKDAVGNLLILSIIIQKKLSITLVNINGQNNNEPEFYRNLKRKLEEFNNDFLVLLGDWNLVQNFNLDCFNYATQNNIQNAEVVQEIKNDFYLVDPWRIYHPNDNKYTWNRKNPIKVLP